MIKKIGFGLIGLLFLGFYIMVSHAMFSGAGNQSKYVKDELMFGSFSIFGVFITMTVIILIVGNFLIDSFYKKRKK